MKKEYEMITLAAYVEKYEVEYLDNNEKEIEAQVEKYILNTRRAETNAKVIEALLA